TPQVQGYDEAGWAVRLDYAHRPVEASLAVFVAVRAATSELLMSLDGAIHWSRAGQHSGSGAYTADDWLRTYAGHAPAHADQNRLPRRGLGSLPRTPADAVAPPPFRATRPTRRCLTSFPSPSSTRTATSTSGTARTGWTSTTPCVVPGRWVFAASCRSGAT